jgi:hypothetical protein
MEILQVREQPNPILPLGRHNHPIIACAKKNTLKLKARLLKQMIFVSLHTRQWIAYPSGAGVARELEETLLSSTSYSLAGNIRLSLVCLAVWRCLLPFGGRPSASLSFQKRRDDGRPTAPADSSQAACRASPSLTTTGHENLSRLQSMNAICD